MTTPPCELHRCLVCRSVIVVLKIAGVALKTTPKQQSTDRTSRLDFFTPFGVPLAYGHANGEGAFGNLTNCPATGPPVAGRCRVRQGVITVLHTQSARGRGSSIFASRSMRSVEADQNSGSTLPSRIRQKFNHTVASMV